MPCSKKYARKTLLEIGFVRSFVAEVFLFTAWMSLNLSFHIPVIGDLRTVNPDYAN